VCHKPPLKRENGTWAKENKKKAELLVFAEHLEDTFTPNCTSEDVEDELGEVINEETGIIPPVSSKEVERIIRQQISPKKAPSYDLITGQILKKLPRKAIIKITHIINAAFRMRYIPGIWKIAEVLMILMPGKSPNKVDSYRPISLLPIMSKLFEKLLLIRLKSVITKKKLIQNHQFGFRNQYSTPEQVHRIVEAIEQEIEEKKICTAVFLDVSQAFDRVWHKGLEYNLRSLLFKQYSDILTSYIREIIFIAKFEDEYSVSKQIRAGVPQGSVL
jgi:hypothetical protein